MSVSIDVVSTWPAGDLLSAVRDVLDFADEAVLATAFVDSRGVHLLGEQLDRLGPNCRLVSTSTFSGDRTAAALGLAAKHKVQSRVLNWSKGTFHPKLYLGRAGDSSRAVVGSANLTSGLFANVELASTLSGPTDAPQFETLWSFAEAMWSHDRARPWTEVMSETPDVFEPDLWNRISKVVKVGDTISTLGASGRPNVITELNPSGIWVRTERSALRKRSELVEPRMVQIAWDWLVAHGTLTNQTLLRQLKVHRSSFVCALLARLPGVSVVPGRLIEITLDEPGDSAKPTTAAGD